MALKTGEGHPGFSDPPTALVHSAYHNLTFLRLSNYVVVTTAEKIAHFKMKESFKSNLYKLFFSSYFDAVFFSI